MTLLNYYNLALLAKKGCHYQRATDLFNTLLRQLTAVTQEAHDVVKVLDGKLLLFVKLHLAEIYERHTGQDVSDHVNNAACSNPHNYANKKKAL